MALQLPKTENWKLEMRDEHILIATNHRPEVRNAMNEQSWTELGEIIQFTKVEEEVFVLIVTGGEKLFAAGADVNNLNTRTPMQVLVGEGQAMLLEMERLPKPTIAAVAGYVLGGGCELAMACDIRIASEKAKFGQPEVNLGILPGGGGTQRLSRLVGLGKARELIFTADIIDAEEAHRIGLANKVVPDGTVLDSALEMARKILSKGPVAVQLSKLAINLGNDTDVYTGLAIERLGQAVLMSTEDRLEGTSAFLEKRPANFKRK